MSIKLAKMASVLFIVLGVNSIRLICVGKATHEYFVLPDFLGKFDKCIIKSFKEELEKKKLANKNSVIDEPDIDLPALKNTDGMKTTNFELFDCDVNCKCKNYDSVKVSCEKSQLTNYESSNSFNCAQTYRAYCQNFKAIHAVFEKLPEPEENRLV